MIESTKLQAYAKFAADIVDRVRPITLKYFRQLPETELKTDGSPVTIADRECELMIRKLLALACPEHGILGEEYGAEDLGKEMTWIIDPIDGTRSFIAGAPTYGTLLALLQQDLPILGVIDIPGLDERWCATIQTPTIMNGQQVKTRSCHSVANSVLSIISPDKFTTSDKAILNKLGDRARICYYSSDGYSYGLLASGYIDLVMAANQQPFDYFPVVNVIEQAGGCITDWNGNPLKLESDGHVLASANQRLHEIALEICLKNQSI